MSMADDIHDDDGAAVAGEGMGGGGRSCSLGEARFNRERRGRGWSSPEDNGGGGARPKSVMRRTARVTASGAMGPGRRGEGGGVVASEGFHTEEEESKKGVRR
jgi:hypothetical protein